MAVPLLFIAIGMIAAGMTFASVLVMFDVLPGARIGHNGGPPLDDDPGVSWRYYCWKKAHKRAWKTPPREIALKRLARAEELGMTYHEYALEIMERGLYL